MSLNTRTEPLENRQLSLVVEVPQDRVDQELRKAARKVSGQHRIPGFRKGKAPYNIVVQYVGLPNLYSEFLDSLGNEVYVEAIKQEEIEPYAMASLDVSSLEPLTYSFEVPLEPTVDLGDYRSLRVDEEAVAVTEEEVQQRLQAIREDYAGWTDVQRPSEYGDMLTIDVRSVLKSGEAESGDEVVVLDETDWDVTLDEENPMEPPGLDRQLLGMSAGEEKEFILEWPEDSQSMYAGKQASFHVKLHQVQANMEPEINDAFAKTVDEDFETLDDLVSSLREAIESERAGEAENAYLEKVLDTLVEQSALDYPPVVVEDQIDSMVSEFARQLRMYGVEDVAGFLSQTGQTMEQYRDSLREQAEIAARRNLIISELYQKEGITVSDEEVEERIADMRRALGGDEATEEQVRMADMVADSMRSGPGRTVLESQIIQEKSLRRLLAIARGEEVPEPGTPEPAAESGSGMPAEAVEPAAEATELEATAEMTVAVETAGEPVEPETDDGESIEGTDSADEEAAAQG